MEISCFSTNTCLQGRLNASCRWLRNGNIIFSNDICLQVLVLRLGPVFVCRTIGHMKCRQALQGCCSRRPGLELYPNILLHVLENPSRRSTAELILQGTVKTLNRNRSKSLQLLQQLEPISPETRVSIKCSRTQKQYLTGKKVQYILWNVLI